MKKTLIAIGLLSAFSAAHAESSVSVYGNINVAITKKGDAGITLKAEEYQYASHIGFKGKEDLGNGYAAIFKLEAELEPDTGSGTYGASKNALGFNRESWVGLLTPYGALRFGRSTTPFVNMWVGGDFGEGRGIGQFTAGIAGAGLRTTQPEVGMRWNNGLFYDVKQGGFAAGLAVTTKGSQSIVPTDPTVSSVDNEGKNGTKPAYGAYARYEGKVGQFGYKIGGAYQVDNGSTNAASTNTKNAPAESKKAWMIGSGVSYGPASFSVGYAKSNIDNTDLANTLTARGGAVPLRTGTSKTLFASMGYDVTPNDHIYASYGKYKRTNSYVFLPSPNPSTGTRAVTGEGELAGTQYSVGYEHKLSKRTVIYTNVRKVVENKNSCTTSLGGTTTTAASLSTGCAASVSRVDAILSVEKGWSYDLGISHSF